VNATLLTMVSPVCRPAIAARCISAPSHANSARSGAWPCCHLSRARLFDVPNCNKIVPTPGQLVNHCTSLSPLSHLITPHRPWVRHHLVSFARRRPSQAQHETKQHRLDHNQVCFHFCFVPLRRLCAMEGGGDSGENKRMILLLLLFRVFESWGQR
jgi:hypothetical protein